ncbi:hypothetical protein A3194_20125 [Candidatus Thiodiazotropha endoloripes]|uniref:hypothetical protein n=1 Tax=Candidatus Thiodiazotropha endoloripes TaxID=1818881 RepID=UPI00083CF43A|nr:hypothetical protein [Candidatus Thiodiazotropha endoloripes]ODB94973.1 hypothetical protein A3194_20125 [Candidatus Thiodiazotropha endoloripes]
MRELQQPGGLVYAIDGKNIKDLESQESLNFCVLANQLGVQSDRGLSTYLAQFFEIVDTGLIDPAHVFKGLKRPMFCGDDRNADAEKHAITWDPGFDAIWIGNRFKGLTRRTAAPKDRVFVSIVSSNLKTDDFPDVDYWIEHWTWVVQSGDLPGAPIDWQTRYKEKLWSKP